MKSSIVLKQSLVPTLAFGAGIFLGLIYPSNQNQNTNFTESRHQENYHFINPLLDCDQANFTDVSLRLLKPKLEELIDAKIKDSKITFASYYIRNLNNGPWIGYHQDEKFSPASLIKVPLMIAYYKMAENNSQILNTTLEYKPDPNLATQNILPSETLQIGKAYTIDELIYRMIVFSDNQAYDVLNKNMPYNKITEVYRDLGVDISGASSDPNGNIVSVGQYSSFFRILFNSSYLEKKYSEKALDLLSKVEFKDGLVKGINDSSIAISHKFGERNYVDTGEKQLHDCGIVYFPKEPYLVCIMTRGKNNNELVKSIQEISKTAFEYIKNN